MSNYLSLLKNNFYQNLIIISLPAFFTNSIWRYMNLNGIATEGDSQKIIRETTTKIAPVIFLVCFLVDLLRQALLSANPDLSYSVFLGFKFYLATILWTVGYEIFRKYESRIRAVGAGLGTSLGLFLSTLVVTLGKGFEAALGTGLRGFFEGYIWAITADKNLSEKWGKFWDSIIVGLTSSLAYAFATVITFTIWYFLRS